tara:strand:+ start:413 stop:3616 length:3204 start_codon:yes stop_codon:yes gene_type:complete
MVATPITGNIDEIKGLGVNGNIKFASDISSLRNALSSFDFSATFETDAYIDHSDINARFIITDSEYNYITDKHIHSYYNENSGESFFDGSETKLDYINPLSNEKWPIRDLVESIASNGVESGYAFLQPNSIGVQGIAGSFHDYANYSHDDVQTLVDSSPYVIELDGIGISEDWSSLDDIEPIQIESADILGLTFSQPEIQISDYLDVDGKVDYLAISDDIELKVLVGKDIVAYKGTESENGGNFNFNFYSYNGSAPSNLNFSTNSYNGNNYGDTIFDDVILDDGTAGTEIFLKLEPHSVKNFLQNSENYSEDIFTLDIQSANYGIEDFKGVNGWQHGHFQFDNTDQSFESISINLDGYTYVEEVRDIPYINFYSQPLLDLANLTEESHIVDFEASNGWDHLSFNLDYSLYSLGDTDGDYQHIGNAWQNYNIDNLGLTRDDSSINIWNQQEVLENNHITAFLNHASFNGNYKFEEDREYGTHTSYNHISLNTEYESNPDSYGVLVDNNSNIMIGQEDAPYVDNFDLFMFEDVASTPVQLYNLSALAFPENIPYDISFFAGSNTPPVEPPPGDAGIEFDYKFYKYNDFTNGGEALDQLAVLGDSVLEDARYVLDVNASSLLEGYNIESTDFTIKVQHELFELIDADDIQLGFDMPIANAVKIDEQTGEIRIAAASLSALSEGEGIGSQDTPLVSIAFDFDEGVIQTLGLNDDGSLELSPLSFDISVNRDETILSTDYIDGTGFDNKEIKSLGDLGAGASVTGQDVTLYSATINLAQDDVGLTLGTDRIIGADASRTNLVRSGDTISTSVEFTNVGNIVANNLQWQSVDHDYAQIVSGGFADGTNTLGSGSFVNGSFDSSTSESVVFNADIEITGAAGNVVDMSEAIVGVTASGSDKLFTNEGAGSSNLITYAGDLNYDGRVSMKDLAYLNAGAARQVLVDTDEIDELGNVKQVASEESYARDVDADFNGKIDMADLSVLDQDWGKSLHNGYGTFEGSSQDFTMDDLSDQGNSYKLQWDNSSFENQNEIEAQAGYEGTLDAGAATSIESDGTPSDVQEPLAGNSYQDAIV